MLLLSSSEVAMFNMTFFGSFINNYIMRLNRIFCNGFTDENYSSRIFCTLLQKLKNANLFVHCSMKIKNMRNNYFSLFMRLFAMGSRMRTIPLESSAHCFRNLIFVIRYILLNFAFIQCTLIRNNKNVYELQYATSLNSKQNKKLSGPSTFWLFGHYRQRSASAAPPNI